MTSRQFEDYIIARYMYGIGEEFLSDAEYKVLEDALTLKDATSEYLTRSWSSDPIPYELLRKRKMTKHIKVYETTGSAESIKSISNEEDYSTMVLARINEPTRVSFKLDGFSIVVQYIGGVFSRAHSRGRSGGMMYIPFDCLKVPKTITAKGEVSVKGELVNRKDKWNELSELYDVSSIRNAVSTVIANELKGFSNFIAFEVRGITGEVTDQYETLKSLGFTVPMNFISKDAISTDKAVLRLSKLSDKYNYKTDGVVIENKSIQYAIRLYSWKEIDIVSYVTGVEEAQGSYNFHCKLEIYPVKVNGITHSKINIVNPQAIVDNNLQIGSPISATKVSDAILDFNRPATSRLQGMYVGRYLEFADEIHNRENMIEVIK